MPGRIIGKNALPGERPEPIGQGRGRRMRSMRFPRVSQVCKPRREPGLTPPLAEHLDETRPQKPDAMIRGRLRVSSSPDVKIGGPLAGPTGDKP